jgi:hypothetical protein
VPVVTLLLKGGVVTSVTQGVSRGGYMGTPTQIFFTITSVVPCRTARQPVNFHYFRSFNGFRNITDSGRVFTISELCLRFPKYVYGFRNMFTVSEICGRFSKYIHIYIPVEGVFGGTPVGCGGIPSPGVLQETTISTHYWNHWSLRGGVRCGYPALVVSRGGYPVRESKKGGPPPDFFQ